MPLQASGQDHFRAMIHRQLQGHCSLCVHFVVQMEHMHLRSSRFHSAREPSKLKALVLMFQKELSLRRWPVRICRNSNAPHGLQDFSNAQELLVHA